jgi:hypothetical protein
MRPETMIDREPCGRQPELRIFTGFCNTRVAAFGRKPPSENKTEWKNAALCRDAATRVGEGRRREGVWQGRRALDALGAMVFLATD